VILFLRIMAISILLAAGSHLLLGLGAEAMLGARLSPETLTNPSLNSQNRFYGTSYMLYGILLWLCAQNLTRYVVIFRLLLVMTFIGGLSRILSLFLHGWPSHAIVALAASELFIPPILYAWHCQSRSQA
jgi:Domain of unknown function (DUF4345)